MSTLVPHVEWLLCKQDELALALSLEQVHLTPAQALEVMQESDPSSRKLAVNWLFYTYLKKGYRWEDIAGGSNSKVFETLTWFGEWRKNLRGKDRNLNDYNSLAEVYTSIMPFLNQEKELDGRAAKREEKEIALRESYEILRTEQLIISVPISERSARWWGKGTRWCTASDNMNYFQNYHKQAPLIILTLPLGLPNTPGQNANNERIDENHKTGVRRFQLWVSSWDVQFMDEADALVDPALVEANWPVFEKLLLWALKKNPIIIQWIPAQLHTKEMVENAVSIVPETFKFVADKFRTLEMGLKAAEKDASLLQYVPVKLLNDFDEKKLLPIIAASSDNAWKIPEKMITSDFWLEAVKINPNCLLHVPKNALSVEICKTAFDMNIGLLLTMTKIGVPEELLSEEFFKEAVNKNATLISCVPEEYLNEEICLNAIDKNYDCLRYIPIPMITAKMCRLAIEKNIASLHHVPVKLIDQEFVNYALSIHKDAFLYLPQKFLTADVIERTIKANPKNIQIIDKKWITDEICWTAIKADPLLLAYIPQSMRAKEICEWAVERKPDALQWVPRHLHTSKMIEIAIHHNPLLIVFVDKDKIEDWIYLKAMEQTLDFSVLAKIPERLLTKEVCERAVAENSQSMAVVPHGLQTKEMAVQSVKSRAKNLQWVCPGLIDQELCQIAWNSDPEVENWIPKDILAKLDKTKRSEYAQDLWENIEWKPELISELKSIFFPEQHNNTLTNNSFTSYSMISKFSQR